MSWLQVDTELRNLDPESWQGLFEELGAFAVWFSDAGDDPVLEPTLGTTPMWPTTMVSALFPAGTNQQTLRDQLAIHVQGCELSFQHIKDRDWPAEWQKSLKPMQFGTNIWVTQSPSDQVPTDAIVVKLTPGLAFGTGEHPTTAMCLAWLEKLGSTLEGVRLLDYGCGSGVLAITAIKLGAAHATAIDIDPQAVHATKENASLNNCGAQISVGSGQLTETSKHDVLVANILSNTLIELGPVLNTLMRPGAYLALSGILANQADAVCASWAQWAELTIGNRNNEWVLLTGTKKLKD